MEIEVLGYAEKGFKVDQMELDISISNIYANYEEALSRGEEVVLDFLTLMKQFGFSFEDFKTSVHKIQDELRYKGNDYKKIGVRYTRNLTLEFDYDILKMSKIIEMVSKLRYAPTIKVKYGLKDTMVAEKEVFAEAYQNAKWQAELIAASSGYKDIKCKSADVNECKRNYYSGSNGGLELLCRRRDDSTSSSSENMSKTFYPEDIVLKQSIKCVFIAE